MNIIGRKLARAGLGATIAALLAASIHAKEIEAPLGGIGFRAAASLRH